MELKGFRDDLHRQRDIWLLQHPDYTSPEATAAVAKGSLRKIVAELYGKGKIPFSEAGRYVDEVQRRSQLINESPAYEKYGEYWQEVVDKMKAGKLGIESEE